MINIALVDDHNLFRTSLAAWLNNHEKLNVVLECENGKELQLFLNKHQVDVVLLDIQMPEMDGIATCEWLTRTHPGIKILIVSFLKDVDVIYQMMQRGAHGYFSKEAAPEELADAIQSLDYTSFFFNHSIRHIIQEAKKWKPKGEKTEIKSSSHSDQLFTQREVEILKWVSQGMKSAEIGDKMNIDVRTVETHRRNIIEKTPAKNMIGAVLWAFKEGWIEL
ncbi:MAG: hypothetical protein RL106_1838 [Bacteroidota bacterium]|jgi:DNA-binding NarL/FixJ family response regulator